jgi:hypothetical protein
MDSCDGLVSRGKPACLNRIKVQGLKKDHSHGVFAPPFEPWTALEAPKAYILGKASGRGL